MQKQYYLYDKDGYYIEPIILDIHGTSATSDEELDAEYENPIPENATDIKPPDGLYKGRFDILTQTWYESATQEEIDDILSTGTNQEPTTEDLLMLQVAELYEEKLEQQSINDTLSLAIADLYERGL